MLVMGDDDSSEMDGGLLVWNCDKVGKVNFCGENVVGCELYEKWTIRL